MPVTWPTAQAEQPAQAVQAGQPVAHPLAGQPANPPRPAVEPRPAEPSAGVVAEAAPAPLDPTTETPRRAGWIGWVLAAAVVAVAAAASYAAFGLVPVVISTAVPLVVAETGIVLLLLALAVTVIRRRLRLAEQRGRRQAQEEAWSRHQQFLRRLPSLLCGPGDRHGARPSRIHRRLHVAGTAVLRGHRTRRDRRRQLRRHRRAAHARTSARKR